VAVPTDLGGCGWYRVRLPMTSITGHDVHFTQLATDPKIQTCDLLYMNRVSSQNEIRVFREVKARGGIVICDFDDNLHTLPASNPCSQIYGNGRPATKIFEESLVTADVVVCSTEELKDEYKKFRQGIQVCKNVLADGHVELLAPKEITGEFKREGEIRIGYAGSQTHFGDVGMIGKALTKIADKYPTTKFCFFGQPPPQMFSIPRERIEYYQGVGPMKSEPSADFMGRYYGCLRALDLDIALAPLEAHVFNKSKSEIKCLEYGMIGYPIVASNYGPYRLYEGPMYRCSEDYRSWVDRLSYLIDHKEARQSLAQENLDYIKKFCTMKNNVQGWQTIIDNAHKGKE
jgi:O-antigen biosynthesis protein